jgi:primary-amine oxidase
MVSRYGFATARSGVAGQVNRALKMRRDLGRGQTSFSDNNGKLQNNGATMNITEIEVYEDGTLEQSRVSARETLKLRPRARTALALRRLLPVLCWLIGSSAVAQGAPEIDQASAAKASLQSHVPGVDETETFSSKSTWRLRVGTVPKFGLVISHARFQTDQSSRFVTVLFDGRFGEIFVPYHPGSPRYADISQFSWSVRTLMPADCPSPPRVAELIGDDKICREKRTYLAWDDKVNVHYGEEVVYWSLLDADRYTYIMEWTFRDDGTILARAGATGTQQIPGIGHMHDFTWRLDIDLDGPGGDSVYLFRHLEDLTASPSTAQDRRELIEVEGGRDWIPGEFNTLQISDRTLQNRNGRQTSYELVPARHGNARHTGDATRSEAYSRHDFWVTRFRGADAELLAIGPPGGPGRGLPDYVHDRQSTVNADVVVWYTSSVHHEDHERDEDHDAIPVLWTGFELRPRNLFDGTPPH